MASVSATRRRLAKAVAVQSEVRNIAKLKTATQYI